jgi:hypothetical protein
MRQETLRQLIALEKEFHDLIKDAKEINDPKKKKRPSLDIPDAPMGRKSLMKIAEALRDLANKVGEEAAD